MKQKNIDIALNIAYFIAVITALVTLGRLG